MMTVWNGEEPDVRELPGGISAAFLSDDQLVVSDAAVHSMIKNGVIDDVNDHCRSLIPRTTPRTAGSTASTPSRTTV